ncbi:hypothetical protein BO70DRAFT_197341 [Aspergillus heteromorphus CBS 117.55]|uniref:Uncharacterized protein n=1 Tax=Aspergillus heteromorphus CBS 117.55 TaxID=1448321 RepID=A0A317WR45_9EURO|nr:uncharacterized protein BO70DRAFT_197341 [Aspergillus heteromorphus CBS 117.55]PWY87587.1 hypothetical protein BO70DRAFT_197341 [Aspergillus heteromorphus CBS 117.55]
MTALGVLRIVGSDLIIITMPAILKPECNKAVRAGRSCNTGVIQRDSREAGRSGGGCCDYVVWLVWWWLPGTIQWYTHGTGTVTWGGCGWSWRGTGAGAGWSWSWSWSWRGDGRRWRWRWR